MYSLSLQFSLLVTLVASVSAAPAANHRVETYSGETTGRFLVTLKDGVTRSSFLRQLGSNATITHEWDLINGFAGHLDAETLNALRANSDVKGIAEDGIVYPLVTQSNAPWGISRLSSMTKIAAQDYDALNYPFTYDSSAGAGVDIYILDTGIYTSHSQFGGRAKWGATFGGYADADGNGHGTHVAGIAGGSQFGVAKAANLIAVKVMPDDGGGSTADIVSGANWVAQQFASTGRPAVASMSLGGAASTTLDSAVTALTNAGVHVAVAAGNNGGDACGMSPGRVASAITVAGTSILDGRASWSNFGLCVDIFAPGSEITSAWIGSTTATASMTGTSMSTPHVSGLMAYLIGLKGNMSPAAMTNLLTTTGLQGAVLGLYDGTPNVLAHLDNSTVRS